MIKDVKRATVVLSNKLLGRYGHKIIKVNTTEEAHYNVEAYSKIFPQESLNRKAFYNIGAGKFRHPFWTNVEKKTDWYEDSFVDSDHLEYDLLSLTKLPVEDNSAEIVYSSHTVEHITDAAAQNMFNEAYRILKPGGILRFSTPNMDLVHRAYKDKDRDFFYWIEHLSIPGEYEKACSKPLDQASLQQIFLYYFASQATELHPGSTLPKMSDEEIDRIFSEMEYEKALNYCTSQYSEEIHKKYPGPHVNWWNFDKASRMLSKAGFQKIYKSGYGQSFCPILRNVYLFDNTHPKVSLYVETIK